MGSCLAVTGCMADGSDGSADDDPVANDAIADDPVVDDEPAANDSSANDPIVDDDPATASTEQAVSWTWTTWHDCSSLSCTKSLGSTADRTCFVAGITGKLSGGSSQYPAGVNVVNNGSYWGLYIRNPSYQNIGVMTTCINNTANRVTASWDSGTAAKLIPAGPNATRRCFLGGVYNYTSSGFSSFSTNARVWRDGNAHFIGGTFPTGSKNRIFATCVDIATSQGAWQYGNGAATTFTGNLAYNPLSGGVACGLTGIGGAFNTADPNKGVWISYDSGTRYWNWTLTPYAGGYALCVK